MIYSNTHVLSLRVYRDESGTSTKSHEQLRHTLQGPTKWAMRQLGTETDSTSCFQVHSGRVVVAYSKVGDIHGQQTFSTAAPVAGIHSTRSIRRQRVTCWATVLHLLFQVVWGDG
eukprot:m.448208 g.448208  ORF g.448208 m.448208 type:complete len:115 (+) comp21505_c1_seq12:8757-9101(+)